MDARSFIRPIIAGLVGIGLIVLLIIIIIKLFFGGSSGPKQQINLVDYANTDATAQLYIDGPEISDQEHNAVRITVGQAQTEIDIIQGYQDNIVQSKTYPNNPLSYATFLQALAHVNFTKGDNSSADQDQRGYCPEQDRFIYKFTNGGTDMFRYWSTSCGQGTYSGNRSQTQWLFEHQIPEKDFDTLTADVPLG